MPVLPTLRGRAEPCTAQNESWRQISKNLGQLARCNHPSHKSRPQWAVFFIIQKNVIIVLMQLDFLSAGILSLIDLSLAGNLLLNVIFFGYENFVSKMNFKNHEDIPEWHGTVSFSILKLKLVASIVAISAIHILEVFIDIDKYPSETIKWMIIINLLFIISGVLFATMDCIPFKI